MSQQWKKLFLDRIKNAHCSVDVELVESLIAGLAQEAALHPGESYELPRLAAMFGAQMHAAGASSMTLSHAVLALDVPEPSAQNIMTICHDAYCRAMKSSLYEKLVEELGKCMPVVLVKEDLPACFLVGPLDPLTFRNALGRLVLLIVRSGATNAIVDGSGIFPHQSKDMVATIRELEAHDYISGRCNIVWAGLRNDIADHVSIHSCRDFFAAIQKCDE